MEESSDWRQIGQDQYLTGVELHWSQWGPAKEQWDHDHCEFYWEKFADETLPYALHAGYTTTDLRRWICETCFNDFRDRFQWKITDAPK